MIEIIKGCFCLLNKLKIIKAISKISWMLNHLKFIKALINIGIKLKKLNKLKVCVDISNDSVFSIKNTFWIKIK